MQKTVKYAALVAALGALVAPNIGVAVAATPAMPVSVAPIAAPADPDNIQDVTQVGPDVGGADIGPESVEAPGAD